MIDYDEIESDSNLLSSTADWIRMSDFLTFGLVTETHIHVRIFSIWNGMLNITN